MRGIPTVASAMNDMMIWIMNMIGKPHVHVCFLCHLCWCLNVSCVRWSGGIFARRYFPAPGLWNMMISGVLLLVYLISRLGILLKMMISQNLFEQVVHWYPFYTLTLQTRQRFGYRTSYHNLPNGHNIISCFFHSVWLTLRLDFWISSISGKLHLGEWAIVRHPRGPPRICRPRRERILA